ncbi:MAG: hypothetical protein KU37_10390 [Sulfuricurvum sp. PC08-66]|nr:MAG: hypothetical protein KU37_10390 [Sulfuricurvum sp. PC08-66]
MTQLKRELTEQAIQRYLKEHFTPKTVAKFADMDWHYLRQELKRFLNDSEIKSAVVILSPILQSMLGALGTISAKIVDYKFSIEVTLDERMMRGIEIIESFAHHLKEHSENVMIFDEASTAQLHKALNCNDEELFRAMVRKAFGYVFDLGRKHSILFGQSRITVRLHIEQAIAEKRFSGIPKESLEELAANACSAGQFIAWIEPRLKESFDFAKMTNDFYETNRIKILQSLTQERVGKRVKQDEEAIAALSNFLLRENFNAVHELLAQQLLEDIHVRRGNSESFLNFYTRGTIVVGGIKYAIPPIMDEDGALWSLPNIKNVYGQYKLIQNEIALKEEGVVKSQTTLTALQEDVEFEMQMLEKAHNEARTIEEGLEKCIREIDACREGLKELRAKQPIDTQQEAALVARLEKALKLEPQLIIKKRNHEPFITKQENRLRDARAKYHNATLRLPKEEQRIQEAHTNATETVQKYRTVVYAVANALSKRRQKL